MRISPGAEITLETNPGTVEHGPFAGYRRAGVNRLSFGVQSFDDDCLVCLLYTSTRMHHLQAQLARTRRAVRTQAGAGAKRIRLLAAKMEETQGQRAA